MNTVLPAKYTLVLLVSALYIVCVNASPTPQQLGQFGGRGSFTGFRKIEGYGDTNIDCYQRGAFVKAPDGCNRCYCELDGKLSSTCSRALCPPGFPSGSGVRRYPSQQSFIKF